MQPPSAGIQEPYSHILHVERSHDFIYSISGLVAHSSPSKSFDHLPSNSKPVFTFSPICHIQEQCITLGTTCWTAERSPLSWLEMKRVFGLAGSQIFLQQGQKLCRFLPTSHKHQRCVLINLVLDLTMVLKPSYTICESLFQGTFNKILCQVEQPAFVFLNRHNHMLCSNS